MTNEPFKGSIQNMLETKDPAYHERWSIRRTPNASTTVTELSLSLPRDALLKDGRTALKIGPSRIDDDSPVCASEKLVAVHSKTGGVKKITLPKTATKVTEAFSGKVVAENAQSFEYDFAEPETALFELEF